MEDHEYEREGVVNLFLFYEPLVGQRWVDVTAQRTKRDWAQQIRELVKVRYPDAERIALVMDNLNTLSLALRSAHSAVSSSRTAMPWMRRSARIARWHVLCEGKHLLAALARALALCPGPRG